MAKTTPLPVFGTLAQTTLHRIAMEVTKLFHELPVVADVEVVIAHLPEVFRFADQSINRRAPRHALLERLERVGYSVFTSGA